MRGIILLFVISSLLLNAASRKRVEKKENTKYTQIKFWGSEIDLEQRIIKNLTIQIGTSIKYDNDYCIQCYGSDGMYKLDTLNDNIYSYRASINFYSYGAMKSGWYTRALIEDFYLNTSSSKIELKSIRRYNALVGYNILILDIMTISLDFGLAISSGSYYEYLDTQNKPNITSKELKDSMQYPLHFRVGFAY